MVAAEQPEDPVTMMGEIAVNPHPAAVTAAVETGDLAVPVARRCAVDAQVAFGAEFDRRMAQVDVAVLAPAAAQAPKFGGCERGGRDACLRRGTDRKRRGKCWLGARQCDRLKGGCRLAGKPPQRRQGILWRGERRHQCGPSNLLVTSVVLRLRSARSGRVEALPLDDGSRDRK